MQSLTWYYQRIKTMSLGEILWRIQSMLRNNGDRFRVRYGIFPSAEKVVHRWPDCPSGPPCRLCDVRVGSWAGEDAQEDEKQWLQQLLRQADRIAEHKFSYFDLKDHDHGTPVNWHYDHANRIEAPHCFSYSIDYREVPVAGDCKYVWEPNRHHQLVVLGRAYRASGEIRYAEAIVEQLDSWMRDNPFGTGMNWRSPLELGIRLINWTWAIDLIWDSSLFAGVFKDRVLHSVYLHLWEITRKYSRGSSANNHLVGEAAGVFVATSYFHELNFDSRWKQESFEILEQEISAQSYPDGCTREQALGYQAFVLQFYLISLLIAEKTGVQVSDGFRQRLEKMLEFVGLVGQCGRYLPLFGDADDGYVLDLGGLRGDVRPLLGIGAVLFNRKDFKAMAGAYQEPVRWFLGSASRDQYEKIESEGSVSLSSHAFTDSGYYLLQSMGKDGGCISLLFDCGELGYKSIAAHGHADALSFVLRVDEHDVLVDPGTYDYFSFPEWREYFRSTRAHNTLEVDGKDQSVMQGPFMWGARAKAECVRWQPGNDGQGGLVTGEHDGYVRLPDPVLHRRTLELSGEKEKIMLQDEVLTSGPHHLVFYFHFSEECSVVELRDNICRIQIADRTMIFQMDKAFTLEVVEHSDRPDGGWVSRGYHVKTPAPILTASTDIKKDVRFTSFIFLE